MRRHHEYPNCNRRHRDGRCALLAVRHARREAAYIGELTPLRTIGAVMADDLDVLIAQALHDATYPHWHHPTYLSFTPLPPMQTLEAVRTRVSNDSPAEVSETEEDLATAAGDMIDSINALGIELNGIFPGASTMRLSTYACKLRDAFMAFLPGVSFTSMYTENTDA